MFQHKLKFSFIILITFFLLIGTSLHAQRKTKNTSSKAIVDTVKAKIVVEDTVKLKPILKLKLFKAKAHASYYANKFNGKRTSSGVRFDNNKYTAAHRKLPFGTKLKITNEENGKSVIVEVIDRGPFSRGREIDLTRRAFMEIVSNKNSGSTKVKIEVIEQ